MLKRLLPPAGTMRKDASSVGQCLTHSASGTPLLEKEFTYRKANTILFKLPPLLNCSQTKQVYLYSLINITDIYCVEKNGL